MAGNEPIFIDQPYLFDGGDNRDLFTPPIAGSDEHACLIAAGLAFIWQLAKRNAYAARLICGASLHWCEQISEMTLYRLLSVTGNRLDILSLRFNEDEELWRKLLQAGVSRDRLLRESAHLSALQAVLTRSPASADKRWPIAARGMRSPRLQVADEAD